MIFLLLVASIILITGVVKAVLDVKNGKCLLCNFKETGDSWLYRYKEDGINRSYRVIYLKCSKCGKIITSSGN